MPSIKTLTLLAQELGVDAGLLFSEDPDVVSLRELMKDSGAREIVTALKRLPAVAS